MKYSKEKMQKIKLFTKIFNQKVIEMEIEGDLFCEVLNVSKSRFIGWKNGEFPREETLINICKILKIDYNQFL